MEDIEITSENNIKSKKKEHKKEEFEEKQKEELKNTINIININKEYSKIIKEELCFYIILFNNIIGPESFVASAKLLDEATKLSGASVHKWTEAILF